MAPQTRDELLDLVTGKLIGAPELGNLALPDPPVLVPVGLHQAQVRAVTRAGGTDVHGTNASADTAAT